MTVVVAIAHVNRCCGHRGGSGLCWWVVVHYCFCVSKAFFVGFLSLLSFGDFFLRNHKNQAEAGYSIFRAAKSSIFISCPWIICGSSH